MKAAETKTVVLDTSQWAGLTAHWETQDESGDSMSEAGTQARGGPPLDPPTGLTAGVELLLLRKVEGALLEIVGSGALSLCDDLLTLAMHSLDAVGDWRCTHGACGHPEGFHD